MHAGQMRVIQATNDYELVVHSPGRRWGKSFCRLFFLIYRILRSSGFVELAAGSQSHASAEEQWEKDGDALKDIVKTKKNQDQLRYLELYPLNNPSDPSLAGFHNEGARIFYPSLGDGAHGLFQGHGLWAACIDEFSHVPYAAWEETLSPMLADRRGHALIYGTPIPDGINFSGFASLWESGNPLNPDRDPRILSMTGRSEENPNIDHAAIAAKRAGMIKAGKTALAACMFDGIFATDLGATFTNLDNVFTIKAKEVEPGLWWHRDARPYESVIVGIDFGRHDDSTVICIFSLQTLEMLAVLRIQRTEYLHQLPIIDRLVRRFPLRQIWSEGREETAAELLRRMYGDSCNLVKWSNGGKWDKNASVARGMDYFERGAWQMIDVPWMREEFRLFERTKLPSGVWRYAAPNGGHDDAVASVLYATYGMPLIPTLIHKPRPATCEKNPYEWIQRKLQDEGKPPRKNVFIVRR